MITSLAHLDKARKRCFRMGAKEGRAQNGIQHILQWPKTDCDFPFRSDQIVRQQNLPSFPFGQLFRQCANLSIKADESCLYVKHRRFAEAHCFAKSAASENTNCPFTHDA